jgi:hypothetical protein
MAEANTAATKTKTAQPATSFGLPHYEIPKFDLPKMEMPEAFRELADTGVAQAKDNYERIRRAAEEMNVIGDRDGVSAPLDEQNRHRSACGKRQKICPVCYTV